MKTKYICDVCGFVFERYPSQIRNHDNVCCSRKCVNIRQKTSLLGENNPNFGNNWSDDKKRQLSDKMKDKYVGDDEYRYAVGSANRGKTLSEDIKSRMSYSKLGDRNNMYGKHHSDNSKEKIGHHSSKKFTEEYKDTHRDIMVSLGYWIPTELKSDWELYNIDSNWIERMFDRATYDEQLLLTEHGVFNNRNNTRGVVRDHIMSRKYGFDNKIFPEILRHPCNCQLILHSDNSSKRSRSDIDIDSLFGLIENYDGDWVEHEICLELIKSYRNDERWVK